MYDRITPELLQRCFFFRLKYATVLIIANERWAVVYLDKRFQSYDLILAMRVRQGSFLEGYCKSHVSKLFFST